jgi:N-acetylmuramoyl-L-alanine amidase
MRVLLIPGHGDGDAGAVGNGYKEADLTREFAKLVQVELLKYTLVDVADTSKNWHKYICEQGNSFFFKYYDYVLEIHFNAVKKEAASDGKTKGTEIYITREEKGNSVEREILKGIKSIGFTNRGVKRKNYDLINHIKKQGVSAALLEVCFIDDIDDMKLYTTKKKEIAAAIAQGIAKGFGLSAVESEGEIEMTKDDVIAIIKEYEEEKAKAEAGKWAQSAFDKATKKGLLDGSAPQGPVSREMLAVVLNRLGALDR